MLFRTLCFEYKIVSVEYFLDRLELYEAKDIAKNLIYCDKDYKEFTRYQLYVAIQSNSKKKIDLKEVAKLPWDNKWLDHTEFKYDEKEQKKLNEAANNIADMLNNNKLQFEEANLMKNDKKSAPKID